MLGRKCAEFVWVDARMSSLRARIVAFHLCVCDVTIVDVTARLRETVEELRLKRLIHWMK